MLVPEGHAAPGALPIWVACTATWGDGDIQTRLLPRVVSGSMDLPRPELCVAPKGYMEARGQGHNLCGLGVWRSCCHQSHPDLSGLCFHPEPGCYPGPSCCWVTSLGPWPCCSWSLC